MKSFDFKQYKDDEKLQKIVSVFLDENFITLDDEQKMLSLSCLDEFIFNATGQKRIKITLVYEVGFKYRGRYEHKYDGENLEDEIIINLGDSKMKSGADILSVYIHEKYHQFEYHSIVYGNDSVIKKVLDIWKWSSYYSHSEDVIFSNYDGLFNPLEVYAYGYEYEQVKSIIDYYTNKDTKKKVKKSLKKVKEELRMTNELNMDYYDLVCEFIEKAKKLYDSRNDVKKTI